MNRDRFIVPVLAKAGWNTSPGLSMPEGIRLVHLPPDSPELQSVERHWPVLDPPLANKHVQTIQNLDRAVAEHCLALAAAPDLREEQVAAPWSPRRCKPA